VPGLDGSDRRPANSAATLDALHRERLAAANSPSREVRDQLARARYLEELEKAQPRRVRAVDPASVVQLPGAIASVSRTVTVPFGFASARFAPDSRTIDRLRQLLASAERVEVRGRTDGAGREGADETTARIRAETARMWLIEHGMPPDAVSVSYLAGGDFVSSNATAHGRAQNRRVEIEFFFDEPFAVGVRAR